MSLSQQCHQSDQDIEQGRLVFVELVLAEPTCKVSPTLSDREGKVRVGKHRTLRSSEHFTVTIGTLFERHVPHSESMTVAHALYAGFAMFVDTSEATFAE